MPVDESNRTYEHPLYNIMEQVPGLSIATTSVDQLLTWGSKHSLFIFPMATSCCAIEFMTAAAGRVDIDQIGAIIRPTPRHCDVMVVAGTITVKMAPRVKKLWDQMPEPKWCVAMGSCAISGDFYRDIYSVVPGVDTIVPVDVYIPGCPPNADQVMVGLNKLKEFVELRRSGQEPKREDRPERAKMIKPSIPRFDDPEGQRGTELDAAQLHSARHLGLGGAAERAHESETDRQGGVHDDSSAERPST